MLAQRVGEDGGVKPVERDVPAIDHVHDGLEHAGLLPLLVLEE